MGVDETGRQGCAVEINDLVERPIRRRVEDGGNAIALNHDEAIGQQAWVQAVKDQAVLEKPAFQELHLGSLMTGSRLIGIVLYRLIEGDEAVLEIGLNLLARTLDRIAVTAAGR